MDNNRSREILTGCFKGFNKYEVSALKDRKIKFVYMVSDGHYIKIGVTENMENRLRSISTGNPRPLKIMAIIDVGYNIDAHTVEKDLHYRLADARSSGEWFFHNNVFFDVIANLTIEGGYKYRGMHIILCPEWKEEARRYGVKGVKNAKGAGYHLKEKKPPMIPAETMNRIAELWRIEQHETN